MPQRHKESRTIKDSQELASKWNFNATSFCSGFSSLFGSLQKLNLPMPQRHKESRAIKDSQASETSTPQAFATDFPHFSGPCKNQIWQCHNATRNRALLKIYKSWWAGETSMSQAFAADFPHFSGPCKNQICQCHNATRNRALIKILKSWQASETAICHKHLNRIFPTFRLLQKIFKSKILKSCQARAQSFKPYWQQFCKWDYNFFHLDTLYTVRTNPSLSQVTHCQK